MPAKIAENGKESIVKLCQYFTTNRKEFLAPGVKEAHVRQSLIDPLFEALGWDVGNKAMTAPQYREVIPEDSLDVEGQQKAPDSSRAIALTEGADQGMEAMRRSIISGSEIALTPFRIGQLSEPLWMT